MRHVVLPMRCYLRDIHRHHRHARLEYRRQNFPRVIAIRSKPRIASAIGSNRTVKPIVVRSGTNHERRRAPENDGARVTQTFLLRIKLYRNFIFHAGDDGHLLVCMRPRARISHPDNIDLTADRAASDSCVICSPSLRFTAQGRSRWTHFQRQVVHPRSVSSFLHSTSDYVTRSPLQRSPTVLWHVIL